MPLGSYNIRNFIYTTKYVIKVYQHTLLQVAVALVCKVARLVVKVAVVVVKVAVVPSNVVALASKAEMDVVQPEGQVSDKPL